MKTQPIPIFIPYPAQIEKQPKQKTKREHLEYSEFKSDGKPKAQAMDSIRSYDDFVAMQNFLLDSESKERVRNWAYWTIGISIGLRFSDLSILKMYHLFNPDKTFRERFKIYEKKTSKLNGVLITQSVKEAVIKYLGSLNRQLDLGDWLFVSQKTKQPMDTSSVWKIFKAAGINLGLPIKVGTHTLRNSFGSIAVSVNKTKIDINSIAALQYVFKHTDQRTTMRYLKVFDKVGDAIRLAVSDFVLGKSEVNKLVPVTYDDNSFKDIIKQLEELKELLLK